MYMYICVYICLFIHHEKLVVKKKKKFLKLSNPSNETCSVESIGWAFVKNKKIKSNQLGEPIILKIYKNGP